jgi:tetratricopeptide (TPR) repeat protein
MSAKKIQLVLIISALVLFVLLFIAPKTAPKSEEDSMPASSERGMVSTDGNLEVYLNMALKNLAPALRQEFDKLKALNAYDSLAVKWARLKRPDLAASCMEELARHKKNAEAWINTGNRYYYSVQFIQDKTEIPVLYQCAMRCFKNGLELDPKNTDARIMLASCYVEGSTDPMEGIKRLREIEKTDSNNVKLQLTFAFFSVKSRQLDRAIRRFDKVLQIDSTYIEAYLHLAEAYEQLGETEKTVEMLQKYSSRTEDVTARLEINKYIQQLKGK